MKATRLQVLSIFLTATLLSAAVGAMQEEYAVDVEGREADVVSLWWYAPILSGNGYGQEAVEYLVGLDKLADARREERTSLILRSSTEAASGARFARRFVGRVGALQHGDSPSGDAFGGYPRDMQQMLDKLYVSRIRPLPHERIVAVCHSEPGAWSAPGPFYDTTPCPPEDHSALITIGRTMFETDRIPSGWSSRLAYMDEIWVPTQFHVETFLRGGFPYKEKLVVVPEAIDTKRWSRESMKGRDLFDLYKGLGWIRDECPVRLLSVFKWEERKGWDVLLSAFYEEFVLRKDVRDDDENQDVPLVAALRGRAAKKAKKRPRSSLHKDTGVCLVIKTSGYHSETEDGDDEEYVENIAGFLRSRYGKKATKPERIHILSSHIPAAHMPHLYGSFDALVQPSRGEGWGRPHSEAMAIGVPVIATNWSGPTAFIEHDVNGFLVDTDGLSTISSGAFKGHQWAEPSRASLRQQMRRVVTEVRKEVASKEKADDLSVDSPMLGPIRRAARATMEQLDSRIVAKTIIQRIDTLLRQQQQRIEEDRSRNRRHANINDEEGADVAELRDEPDSHYDVSGSGESKNLPSDGGEL